MKAVFYRTHGGPEVLEVGDLPVPEPGDNQVLVQIAAAAVNPIDRRLRAGELQEYSTRTFPVVPGWDFSGRITRVGANVTRWKAGDEVLGLAFTWSIQHGTYAEYGIVDASSIALKATSLSFTQAAALPLVNLTAWQALTEFANVQAGHTVLIQAGAGGVGSVAIPMAKHLGATVYTVNSTGRRNTSMMRCCDAETETETVRPGGSACDAFAWSAAGNGACGAATVLEGDRAGAVE